MKIKVPMRFDSVPLLWTVDGVYTPAECEEFIEKIEDSRPSLATNNPGFRDQDRYIEDEPEVAGDLFNRLQESLPAEIEDFRLLGLNERLRYYRYRNGQQFTPHMDHWYNPNDKEISLLTVLVYFNSDFTGGGTRFMEQLEETVKPQAGRVAVFQHKIRHEGCAVKSGTKYALRTDVMYTLAG